MARRSRPQAALRWPFWGVGGVAGESAIIGSPSHALVSVQVEGFAARYMAKGYTSCWGDVPPPDSFTTFNSRTYLQAELHQATPSPTYAAGRDDDQACLAWRCCLYPLWLYLL